MESGPDPDEDTGFLPAVPYNLPIIGEEETARPANTRHYNPYHPGSDILSAVASSGVESQLVLEDPFYILSCVYHTAARARIQVLSFIESEIAEISAARGPQQSQASEQLPSQILLLQRLEQFSKEDLENISRMGWETKVTEIMNIRDKLQVDYEYLVEKCKSITRQCERARNALVSAAQQEESRAGARESRNVAELTALAMFFIPLGYVSSLLSMNVTQIKEGVPIWIWAAASGVLLVATGIVIAMLRWRRR